MLLAAAAGFQKRFYSTLAGFMEPGETCEQAVIREVRGGYRSDNVRYITAWPFPSQVMLGFFAEWQSGEIELDPNEIEDADWFDMRAMPPTPPMASISGQLISRTSWRTCHRDGFYSWYCRVFTSGDYPARRLLDCVFGCSGAHAANAAQGKRVVLKRILSTSGLNCTRMQ